MNSSPYESPAAPVRVERWSTELPLLAFVIIASGFIWMFLAISIIGMAYAVILGLFFFVSHILFITYLRGSAVKLGPEQMPELYRRVEELARQVGLRHVPDAYILQAGGALNALATKLFATNFIVLFSDLLEACGDNTEARDMVIGHELGHLKAGHLRWMWFLLPGFFLPFLGTAYSRAREYTCDRYGMAVCSDRAAGLRGLAILAAGGVHGRRVDLAVFARQRQDLNRAWMTLGHWFSGHPPLAYRIAALDPVLAGPPVSDTRGSIGALAILGSLFAVPFLAGLGFSIMMLPGIQKNLEAQGLAATEDGISTEWDFGEDTAAGEEDADPTIARLFGHEYAVNRVREDIQTLAELVEEYRSHTGQLPADNGEVMVAWQALRSTVPMPVDPFDGLLYAYENLGNGFRIWSIGPDPLSTDDDIQYFSTK